MQQFGLLGKSLKHSFSKQYFEQKFREQGLTNCAYHLIELDSLDQLDEYIQSNKSLLGFNVTIPYKESIINKLNSLDATSQEIKAVNTVKILRNSDDFKLVGYNTDAYGFHRSIKPFLTFQHSHALILGTGGAAKAAAYVLKNLGIEYRFVSRTPGNKNSFGYDDLNEAIINHFKFIVNASPAGMHPFENLYPLIPYEFISSEHFLFDMVYNPSETIFLKKGKAKGALTLNGLDMLHHQADKSWEIWNNKDNNQYDLIV